MRLLNTTLVPDPHPHPGQTGDWTLMESEISVRPGHNIDAGTIMSTYLGLSSHWSELLITGLLLVHVSVLSICEVFLV